jgi:hypothetical protein
MQHTAWLRETFIARTLHDIASGPQHTNAIFAGSLCFRNLEEQIMAEESWPDVHVLDCITVRHKAILLHHQIVFARSQSCATAALQSLVLVRYTTKVGTSFASTHPTIAPYTSPSVIHDAAIGDHARLLVEP